MAEITFELTDYCPHSCKFCSSHAGNAGRLFLGIDDIIEFFGDTDCTISEKRFDIINLSGGEPMAHPHIWAIMKLCRRHLTPLGELWIYTNAFDGIRYNTHVRDRVKIHANVTIDEDTEVVHVLKRQKHGREAKRPEVTFSGGECKTCEHVVIRPNGNVEKPCRKTDINSPQTRD